ncbi:MAG TPA: DNA mismatch repair endonuclease MutL [Anaerohalosphaeraceae bacterium]|nr:DNA mismatch repair endonuclease MutL [Anaerohalosphaeraceae bacterium]HPP57354.1 DNA mismatch repair endonuclease MutL [Anaerohalosphaeraceae bacterium]
MGKIAVLDDNLVNMIAAGEVIERPASVVKELMENSIDAGARRIVVQVEQGGRDLIRVSDDGCGIAFEDLPLAFEPHATSKIRTSEDLLRISTMGFRGEALASIAAVSRLVMVSRPADSIQAGRMEIDCGQKSPPVPAAGPVGTTVEVRHLFYKLPARRKFLRSANTEMTHVVEQFTRIALAYPELELVLEHGGRTVYSLRAGQLLAERIGILFPSAVAEDLLEVRRQEKAITIQALLGRPDRARTSSSYQYIFLNRRFIRDKFILHAFKEAYRGLIEPQKHPVVFLFLQMPPELFDVNVHPTKTEVRFENANWVYSQVLSALRDKLLSTELPTAGTVPASAASFHAEDPLEELLQKDRESRIRQAMDDFFQSHSAGTAVQKKLPFSPVPPADWKPLKPTEGEESKDQSGPLACLQIHNSYLVLSTEDGFEVIDQHALHERILYERLRAAAAAGPLASQRLLVPVILDVSDAQLDALKRAASLVGKLGIEWDMFGPRSIAVHSFPVLLEGVSVEEYIQDMLDAFLDKGSDVDEEQLLAEVLERAACRAAVKAGQPLTPAEIEQLLADRKLAETPGRCPHGRPTSLVFTLKELEKQFKRTGF